MCILLYQSCYQLLNSFVYDHCYAHVAAQRGRVEGADCPMEGGRSGGAALHGGARSARWVLCVNQTADATTRLPAPPDKLQLRRGRI